MMNKKSGGGGTIYATFLGVHVLFVGLTNGQISILRSKVEAGGGTVSEVSRPQQRGSKLDWDKVTHIVTDRNDNGLSPDRFLEMLRMTALPEGRQTPPVVQLSWVNDSEKKRQLQDVSAPAYAIRISASAPPPQLPLLKQPVFSPRAYLASLSATYQNEEIVRVFKELLKYASPDKGQGGGPDNFRYKSYNQVIITLRRLPKIRSIEDLVGKNYTGFGKSNLDKVRQILETGTCDKLLTKQRNKRDVSLRELTGVHGVGYHAAVRLHDEHGCKCLDDLRALVQRDPTVLTGSQTTGLRYYEEIETGITDDEVQAALAHVRRAALTLDSHATLTLCGSGCRVDPKAGVKLLSGDIDIIVAFDVSHDESKRVAVDHSRLDTQIEEGMLSKLVELLTAEGILTHHLSGNQDSTSYLGLCVDTNLPVEQRLHRRIDIRVYAQCVECFATLSYCSSMIFNRAIRTYAKRYTPDFAPGGMYISDLGLFKSLGSIDKHERCPCKTQEEVFHTLGLQFRPPWQRLSADDLVPLLDDNEAVNSALGVVHAEDESEERGEEGREGDGEGGGGLGEKRKPAWGGGWGGKRSKL